MVGRNSTVRVAVVGFIAAIGVFAVLFWFIDVNRFLQALRQANPIILGVMVVIALGWLTAWSLSLRTVLGVLETELPVTRSIMTFASVLFAYNVTPLGQFGGEPVAAAFVSRISDADYETGLASVTSLDAINFIPSITLALLGLAYYAIFTTLGQYLVIAVIVVVALAIVVPVLLYLGWQYRYQLERRSIDVLTPLLRRTGRIIPRVSVPDPESIEQYVENFFTSLERITSDRRGISIALSFSALGWLLQMVLLWVSFIALDHYISFTVVLLVIPIGNIAGIAPLPGGLGAIETIYIVLLSALTPVNIAVITAAVVIHRVLAYGLPTIIGGGTIALFSVHISTSG
jgi:uncharacterized protein (TIRG00374 family)